MSTERAKILIVDDRQENLLSLLHLLDAPDLHLITATSGQEALSHVLDHDFALALVDVHMPEMSGFELASLMRGTHRSRRIPIIFVTASQNDMQSVFQGYEHGAVDFLLKPLDPFILMSKIRVFVDLHRKEQLLKEKLAEVEGLRRESEAASRAKSRFLSTISHEIRTPLSAILGFADLLREMKPSQEEHDRGLEAIVRNANLLRRLIENVLDLSKIEAGKLDLQKERVNLREVLDLLMTTFSENARAKGVEFRVEVGNGAPKTLYTDPLRLQQILNNLVGNALKFTERGYVLVRVEYHEGQGQPLVHFIVRDTGPGIPASIAERLFEPFIQGETPGIQRHAGTGLGLAISRELAQALGGNVVLEESGSAQGSVFVCTLPALTGEPAGVGSGAGRTPADIGDIPALTEILKGTRVLVVDDLPDNRDLLSQLLDRAGAVVLTASCGSEALARAGTFAPDLILMDLRMPEMDGCETARRLRANGYNRPILALSAHALGEELNHCLEAGCNDYLIRPVPSDALLQKISGLLHAVRKDALPAHGSSPRAL